METISKFTAWTLCERIRSENEDQRLTFNGLWCWGCIKFAHGDPNKMCVSNTPDYRGCAQVNARYDATIHRN
jgi:hypothetical protein